MNKKVAIILINYKDYAEKFLDDCMRSLRKQDYNGRIKIFIVDNKTSEESSRYLKEKAPEVEIIRNKNNDGFAKGNNDAMKIAIKRDYEYIILFNMDTVIESDCVSQMVKVANSSNKNGAVQARLMLHQNKELINSMGNVTHFLGFGYSEGNRDKWIPDQVWNDKEIAYPSGAAVLFKSEVLKKVGLFDEEFWMYNEDQDLGWRIWLAGYKCVLAPDAVAYHKYEFSRSIKKYYWMDRNRMLVILKNYHIMSLILIIPAFIVMEFGLLLYSYKSGWFQEKIKVYKYFLSNDNWQYITKRRQEIQKLRKVKDIDIIKLFSGKIWYQEIDGIKLRIANIFFNVYWNIVKKIIIW